MTDNPKVGDIVCYDENRKIRFIALDTFKAGTFPSAWETVGVVVIRKGNQIKICSKENKSCRQMEVYPYIVSGYALDGIEHAAQLRLHGKPTTETFYEFKYTASTVDEFVAALQQLLTSNGETDWSAYKDGEDRVILQYDNYTSAEYYGSSVTYATGLILTAKFTFDYPEFQPNFWRKCGNRGNGVWHTERAKEIYINDIEASGYNPPSDVSSVPSYPVCYPAFCGTSAYQEDHCLWLRQRYCKDPAHPTLEEWKAYIDSLAHIVPYMTGGHAPKWREGQILGANLRDVVYRTADGTNRKLYPAVDYCSEFMGGQGYMPSMTELIEAFRSVTYGLSGITRDKSDPINRSLYAIGGSSIQCNATYWIAGLGATAPRTAGGSGIVDSLYFYYTCRTVPFATIELPLID